MNNKFFRKLSLRELVFLALLIAMSMILQKFSIGNQMVRVGFGFLGTVMMAYYFGPVWGGFGAGIADVLSSLILGSGGPFFIGFTISAITAGVIYGLFLYNLKVSIWKIVLAVLAVTVIVNVIMNTLWVSMMSGLNFWASLTTRIPKQLIAPWIQMALIWILLTALQRVKIKGLINNRGNNE